MSGHSAKLDGLLLFLFFLLLFSLTTHGGIKSPDSEIAYRTAQALARDSRFDIDQGLSWKHFGWADGVDGKKYSVFGVAQSVALVPFVWLADWAEARGVRLEKPPISFYATPKDILVEFGGGSLQAAPEHTKRMWGAWLNVLVGALCVLAFWRLLNHLKCRRGGALVGAAVFGTCSLIWSYSACYFSEELATLFVVLALGDGVRADFGKDDLTPGIRAGFFLGLAVLTHLSAILFVPFFLASRLFEAPMNRRRLVRGALAVGLGLLGPLLLLGYYNDVRFGSPFETGRGVDPLLAPELGYGTFVWPGRGIYGLSVSWGKGLIVYMPIVIFSLLLWRHFFKRVRSLAVMTLLAVLTRILFLSCRSDWHGGLCIGPRYLVMAIPMLLLPVCLWLNERYASLSRYAKAAVITGITLLILQQAYLVSYEEFHFLFAKNREALQRQEDIWADDVLFTSDAYSPMWRFAEEGVRGPFLLKEVPVKDWELILALTALAAAFTSAGLRKLATEAPAPAERVNHTLLGLESSSESGPTGKSG